MIISNNKWFIFIHIQRTGGTAFSTLLRAKIRVELNEFYQHTNIETLGDDFFEARKAHRVITFVRNPWARLFSWYSLFYQHDRLDLKSEKLRFEKFLLNLFIDSNSDPCFHFNQLDYFMSKHEINRANIIGEFENYEEHVQQIFKILDIPFNGVPRINASDNKDYRNFYTNASRAFVEEKCQRDIDYFKYTFDGVLTNTDLMVFPNEFERQVY